MQGKDLRALEAELWRAADQLRANSKLTASEYSMPVLGLIFLRHAYNRFRKVKEEVEHTLPVHPQRGRRALAKEDFAAQNAMYLPEKAQFQYLVSLPESEPIGEAIDAAMKAIEAEHPNLQGVLPHNFSVFSPDLLRELLRIFNKEVLRKAEGDLFGKIYEYFLGKFAMTGAQEGGEFFTPMSLVQTIVNIIEPNHGTVFDPACGSAGMFVQTGYFIQSEGGRPAEKVTFYGQEKADLNTRLAKMNLAVHGLEGKILGGNTFYEDAHNMVGGADFVMANPPFNVDGVDKAKEGVKRDQRLSINGTVSLPKNDNANYLWIQYFYNYLKPTGRAGFVMASSASDAGHSERDIREKLVNTGAVDVMVAIGNNFFYTRSLPCTLWFYDKAKAANPQTADKVLMLDARKIYRKVTSKVNDFSPEQLANLVCIVDLYRGNTQKLQTTVAHYLQTAAGLAGKAATATAAVQQHLKTLLPAVAAFLKTYAAQNSGAAATRTDWETLIAGTPELYAQQDALIGAGKSSAATAEALAPVAQLCKALRKPQDKALKSIAGLLGAAAKEHNLGKNADWRALETKETMDALHALGEELSGNPGEEEPGLLHQTEYFYRQAHWLLCRFPAGKYENVEGLCKVVNREEIAAKDWSLSPGRYVGVDAGEEDEVDTGARLSEIHTELAGLHEEAAGLAEVIAENYKGLLV